MLLPGTVSHICTSVPLALILQMGSNLWLGLPTPGLAKDPTVTRRKKGMLLPSIAPDDTLMTAFESEGKNKKLLN